MFKNNYEKEVYLYLVNKEFLRDREAFAKEEKSRREKRESLLTKIVSKPFFQNLYFFTPFKKETVQNLMMLFPSSYDSARLLIQE